jgi:hypothetical protein
VLKVIEPLEEAGAQMVMVTEPVFGSLANALTGFSDVASAPQDRAGSVLSALELKYGLHSVAGTLHFLHHEAKLVHCNLHPGAGVAGVACAGCGACSEVRRRSCNAAADELLPTDQPAIRKPLPPLLLLAHAPGSIIISKDGAWKLAGFEFVTSSGDGLGSGAKPPPTFEYASAQPSRWEECSQVRACCCARACGSVHGSCTWMQSAVASGRAHVHFSGCCSSTARVTCPHGPCHVHAGNGRPHTHTHAAAAPRLHST